MHARNRNHPSDGQESSEESHAAPRRIVIFGAAGQLGGTKLEPTLTAYHRRGVEIYGCDIINESEFKPRFGLIQEYFNLRNQHHREKLFDIGRKERFDLAYEATWPDVHLLDIVNWEAIFRDILVTKPFVSVRQYNSLKSLMELPGYDCVLRKVMMHDHYANKPAMAAVVGCLPRIHRKYGKYSRMTIMITERRTVNDSEEVTRHAALAEGMIPDLASHGLMVVQLLTPNGLVWEDEDGARFKRLEREIIPTACVRAQLKNAAVAQDIDTACIIEYRVTEQLTLVRDEGSPIGRPFTNEFFVLIVCGKGLRATADSGDLKAVEICFQGQGHSAGVLDLETNSLNEVLEAVPGIGPLDGGVRAHRGINRPLLTILDRWQEYRTSADLRSDLFQVPPLIWENMTLLFRTMSACRRGILPSYERKDLIHHFVNTHIGPSNGFQYFGSQGSGWPMKEPPLHLMRGHPITPAIP